MFEWAAGVGAMLFLRGSARWNEWSKASGWKGGGQARGTLFSGGLGAATKRKAASTISGGLGAAAKRKAASRRWDFSAGGPGWDRGRGARAAPGTQGPPACCGWQGRVALGTFSCTQARAEAGPQTGAVQRRLLKRENTKRAAAAQRRTLRGGALVSVHKRAVGRVGKRLQGAGQGRSADHGSTEGQREPGLTNTSHAGLKRTHIKQRRVREGRPGWMEKLTERRVAAGCHQMCLGAALTRSTATKLKRGGWRGGK